MRTRLGPSWSRGWRAVLSFPAGVAAARLVATARTGGHGGVDIHHQRLKAIRVLVRALDLLVVAPPDLRIVELRGGAVLRTWCVR